MSDIKYKYCTWCDKRNKCKKGTIRADRGNSGSIVYMKVDGTGCILNN